MNQKAKESWDLLGIAVSSILLVLSIAFLPEFPLRIVLGLPFLLFFPGYVLIAFLFPEKKSLEIIERIALSFGLSIAVTPLIGFALNYTPFGIRLAPILVSITAFNLGFSYLAWWRRYKIEEPYLPFDLKGTFNSLFAQYRSEGRLDRALSIILVISIVSSGIALAYVIAVPRQGESFTEFYILGPGHNASGYPHRLRVGEQANVIVGIANHERRQVHYFIQTWLVNASFIDNRTVVHELYYLEQFDVVLGHKDVDLESPWESQWEMNYSFSIPIEGKYKVWFFLFLDQVPWYAEGLQYMQDCRGTPSEELVQKAVRNELLSLNLNLDVRA
ncbi:MAG: DUF1616 domain-containing protein [Methanomassiliicoccales archaeon]